MNPLPPDLRTLLARTIQRARRVGEAGQDLADTSNQLDDRMRRGEAEAKS